ncbi:hypothetical protein BB561_000626 [Smittium simulii]|uniref:Reverse transcriptase domain-containing protein n=1 Tax=Smittium simulii TaxID=133385 RepID=A0A2T9YYA1_9FUNG|nr:hypothetical protein BB561_000626 [Smittium simulii]
MARIPRFHRGGRGSIPRIGGGSVAQWTRRLTTNQEIPDEPILNTNRNMIMSLNAKLNVWAKKFGDLADNTTGNSQNNTNGALFLLLKQFYIMNLKILLRGKSIVVPVLKKQDLKDPNNHRGTSLIPTIIKLVSKIATDKLSRIEQKYNISVKEQAYFAKAYNKVPQSALLTKIVSVGIGGKLLSYIKVLYKNPKMCVKIGNQASQLVNLTAIGELFGISEQRNNPIQKASDQALRLIAGVGKNTALDGPRTEIADLTKDPIIAGASTWVSGTAKWLNKYTKKVRPEAKKNKISDRYYKNINKNLYFYKNS